MEDKRTHPIVFLVGIVLLLSLACKAVSFIPTDSETASPMDVAETQEAEAEISPTEIPPPVIGETISADGIEIFVPPEPQNEAPPITAKLVSDSLPPAPEESTIVGKAYEITADGELSGPVLISIGYDPAGLPPNVAEENLYIATQVGDRWEVVPDGFVDTHNHTVNASVDHFSVFSIFQSMKEAIYDTVQTTIGDEITPEYFDDLPDQIRHELYEKQIKPQDVTAVIHAKLSLVTKAASGMISFGNLVSKTAGLAIGAIDEGVENLAWAMGELIFAEVGDDVTDSRAGSFIVAAYDSFDLGREIGKYVYKLEDANPGKAAVMASSWILAREMEYINANLDPAFDGLWKLNTLSGSRLDVYAVYFDAVPWPEESGYGAGGVKFYYYDEGKGQWVNYYNDVFVWKMTFEPEETEGEIAQAPGPDATKPQSGATPGSTDTPRPTSTPQPSATPRPTSTKGPTATVAPPTSGDVYVAADGSGDYPTIQEAIDAVEPGTTIFLDSGTYYEELEISKSITLLGARKDLTEIYSDAEDVIEFTGNGVLTVEDITIQGTQVHAGLYIRGGEFEVRNVRVSIDDGIGMYIQAGTGIIQSSEILGASYSCVYLGDQADVTIEQNLISNCSYGLSIEDGAGGFIHHNEVRGHKFYGISVEQAGAIIEDNIITDNGETGIHLSVDASAEIRRNDCSRNGDFGIYVQNDGPYVIVEDNRCNYNGYNGISLVGPINGTVQGNECAWNEVNGIEISDDSNVTLGVNNCHDNGNKDVADWRSE